MICFFVMRPSDGLVMGELRLAVGGFAGGVLYWPLRMVVKGWDSAQKRTIANRYDGPYWAERFKVIHMLSLLETRDPNLFLSTACFQKRPILCNQNFLEGVLPSRHRCARKSHCVWKLCLKMSLRLKSMFGNLVIPPKRPGCFHRSRWVYFRYDIWYNLRYTC